MKYLIIIILFFQVIHLNADIEWVQKHKVDGESIKNIEFVDSLNCYAFAQGRKEDTRIYHSTDQGDTWNLIYEQIPDTWTDSIYTPHWGRVLYNEYFYITYQSALVIDISSDGGETFDRRFFGEYSSRDRPAGRINDFVMYDENVGIIATTFYNFYTFDSWKTYHV